MSRNRVIAILAFVFPVLAFTLWPLSFMDWNDGMIDQGWALGYLCSSFIMWKCTNEKFIQITGKIGFWLSVNNAMDEFLFDPLSASFGEYIFAATVVTSMIFWKQIAWAIKKSKQWLQQSRIR